MISMCNKAAPEGPGDGFSLEMARLISRGAETICSGGIVAFPTDTVYGLGADIYNDSAVLKVFSAKARPLAMPLPVLIAEREAVNALVADLPAAAVKLMDRFWPGGLTLIFKRHASLHSLVLAGSDKIGIRVPGHTLTRELIRQSGSPVAGTSANLHDKPAPLTAAGVKEQLGGKVDFIIDGGLCPGGIESTIIDVTLDPPAVIRQGIIPLAAIDSVIKTGRN